MQTFPEHAGTAHSVQIRLLGVEPLARAGN
jgi:hypothetical protein